jgi:transposase
MPFKSDRLAIRDIDPDKDRRRKLDPALHDEIKARYAGGDSQRQLALEYGVSRSLIQLVVNPDRAEAIRRNYEARGGWRAQYDRETHTKAIREHRRYKNQLLKEQSND